MNSHFFKFWILLGSSKKSEQEQGPTSAEERSNIIGNFLRKYSPNALTVEDQQAFDAPLSLEEWEKALKSTKPGKCPGPDGFSAQYYKSYAVILGPSFLEAFNSLARTPGNPSSLLEAYIKIYQKRIRIQLV